MFLLDGTILMLPKITLSLKGPLHLFSSSSVYFTGSKSVARDRTPRNVDSDAVDSMRVYLSGSKNGSPRP